MVCEQVGVVSIVDLPCGSGWNRWTRDGGGVWGQRGGEGAQTSQVNMCGRDGKVLFILVSLT